MPIYEYICKTCEAKFDKLVRTMSSANRDAEADIACPECGSAKTARALSVFAVGAEGAKTSATRATSPGCGRCGGPGPCPSGY